MRLLVFVLLISACKREPSPERSAPGSGSPTAPTAAPIVDASSDAAPIDAPAQDAPSQRPSEAQAFEATKAWMAAVITKKAAPLVAASALPFQLVDRFNRTSCGEDTLDDAKEFEPLVKCFGKDGAKLAATFGTKDPKLEYSAEMPDVPAMLQSQPEAWNGVMPEAQRGSHAFVVFIHGHPKYWSDVLYAVFAVRIVDGVAKVGGVALVFSQEGE